jgi:hypothetical protein
MEYVQKSLLPRFQYEKAGYFGRRKMELFVLFLSKNEVRDPKILKADYLCYIMTIINFMQVYAMKSPLY